MFVHLELVLHLLVDLRDVPQFLLQGRLVALELALHFEVHVLVLDLLVVDLGLELHVLVDLALQFVLAAQHFVT